MIGLDTNVLIRYVVEDDDAQTIAAERVVEALTNDEPGFVSLVALAEVARVLKNVYRLPQDEILPIVDGMLSAEGLRLQQADVVKRAVRAARATSVDFSDALISTIGAAAGCDTTVTFDRAAAELDGMTLLTS